MELGELNGKVQIIIAGETVEVNATDPVKATLKKILEDKGIVSFSIIVDGNEILSSDALPETFADCDSLEVRRYMKAGR